MAEILIQNAVEIAATLLITLIGIAGTWLMAKMGKRTELQNVHAALGSLQNAAQCTVLELKQTVLDGLKAAHEDGKLTKDEIAALNKKLVKMTIEKMSASSIELLNGAGIDVNAYIIGVGEAVIVTIKAKA